MSRYYRMNVEISDYNRDRLSQIEAVADDLWGFQDSWYVSPSTGHVYGDGENRLGGGESEATFARRLTYAIWEANGGFCKVTVLATYLENLPYDTYELDAMHFEAWQVRERRVEA